MDILRNPFARRNGKIILIEDLSENERGLKCKCKCPNPKCNGDFIARMGEVRVHHFAHSNNPCDETLAYLSGLYEKIQDILSSGTPFYVPAVVISYSFPLSRVLDETNIDSHIRYIPENSKTANSQVVSDGKHISFESVELCYDDKNRIQALELTYKGSKMAIKVKPPDTICKTTSVSPHQGMATLVLDFAGDEEAILKSNSQTFQEYLLSEQLDKYWIYNPKVQKVYPEIIGLSKKAYENELERQKQHEEKMKAMAQQQLEKQYHQEMLCRGKTDAERAEEEKKQKEQLALGYEQVKDKFVQQTDQIRDNFDKRWVQCELCGEIKRETEFTSYGGLNHINLGRCRLCNNKK